MYKCITVFKELNIRIVYIRAEINKFIDNLFSMHFILLDITKKYFKTFLFTYNLYRSLENL